MLPQLMNEEFPLGLCGFLIPIKEYALIAIKTALIRMYLVYKGKRMAYSISNWP